MVTAIQSEPNNEDAKSTSSTLVNGEHSTRNEPDAAERTTTTTTTTGAATPTAATTTTAATATTATATDETNNNNRNTNLNLPQIRHGFDQEMYEEDIIRFLYFSEKRHDSNAQPNATVRNALKDWVSF